MKEYKRINKSGSLSIPVKLRREYNINSGDAVIIEPMEKGGFTVKPFTDQCCLCGGTDDVKYILGKGICYECAEKINELLKEGKENE